MLVDGNPEPQVTWQRRVSGFWQTIDADDDNFIVQDGKLVVPDTNLDQSGSLFRARLRSDIATAYTRAAKLTVALPAARDLVGVHLDWTGSPELQRQAPSGAANFFSAGESDGSHATYSAATARRARAARRGGRQRAAGLLDRSRAASDLRQQAARAPGRRHRQCRGRRRGDGLVDRQLHHQHVRRAGAVHDHRPRAAHRPGRPRHPEGVAVGLRLVAGQPHPADAAGARGRRDDRDVHRRRPRSGGRGDDHARLPRRGGRGPGGQTQQDRTGDGWGAWPQPFVDFQVQTGLGSYWYSSGGAADPHKAPDPVVVDRHRHGHRKAGRDPGPDLGVRPGAPPLAPAPIVAPPKPAAKAKAKAKAPTITLYRIAQPVSSERLARVATLACPAGTGSCKVTAPKRTVVLIAGQRYSVIVLAPKTIGASRRPPSASGFRRPPRSACVAAGPPCASRSRSPSTARRPRATITAPSAACRPPRPPGAPRRSESGAGPTSPAPVPHDRPDTARHLRCRVDVPVPMPRLARFLLIAAVAALLGAPPAVAHDAPMPPGKRHGLLPNERWVMQHWSPLDEQTLAGALGIPLPQVEAFLYNDHHTLAQLALARGLDFETLVGTLAAWTARRPARADREAIEQRIRLMLVSGHLAQHVLFHVFHGEDLSPRSSEAAKLPATRFATLRNDRWSYRRLILRAGGDPAAVAGRLATQIRHRQQTGLDSGQTPAGQGDRLVARQLRRLPCWFGRAAQPLDPAAPYDRAYTKHAPDHTDKDVPTTRAQQTVEDRLISRGLAQRPHACWDLPEQFADDPGPPLTREHLRALARLPLGYQGAVNDPHPRTGRRPPSHQHRSALPPRATIKAPLCRLGGVPASATPAAMRRTTPSIPPHPP